MASLNFREFWGTTGQDNVHLGTEDGAYVVYTGGVERARITAQGVGGGLFNALLLTGGTLSGSLTLQAQKKIILSTDGTDLGSVTRLIEFHAGTIIDRPWVSWFDQNSRHVGATGFHDTLPAGEGGTQLKQYEVKTIADAAGPGPTELRTRFAIQYDVQRGTWGVNFIDNFEINQGENPILTTPGVATPFGLRLRAMDSLGANFVAAQLLATIDATDNISVNLDAKNNNVVKTANLIIGRNTNTSSASGSDILIKKMDGSNTTVFQFRPRTSPPLIGLGYTGDTGVQLVINSDTGLQIGTATTQKLAFYGTAPTAKQTVTGSKGANAALTSLMTALAALGLVVDTTT